MSSEFEKISNWHARQNDLLSELNSLAAKRYDPNTAPKKAKSLDSIMDKFIRRQFGNFKNLQDAVPLNIYSQIPLSSAKDTALVIKLRLRDSQEEFLRDNGFKNKKELEDIIDFSLDNKKKIRFVIQNHAHPEKLTYLKSLTPIFADDQFDSPLIPYFEPTVKYSAGFLEKADNEFKTLTSFQNYLKKNIPAKFLESTVRRYSITYAITKDILEYSDKESFKRFKKFLNSKCEDGLTLLKFYGRTFANVELVPVHYNVIEQMRRGLILKRNKKIIKYQSEIAQFIFENYLLRSDSLEATKYLYDMYDDIKLSKFISDICEYVEKEDQDKIDCTSKDIQSVLENTADKAERLNMKAEHADHSIPYILGAVGLHIPENYRGLLDFLTFGASASYPAYGPKLTRKIVSLNQKPHVVSLLDLIHNLSKPKTNLRYIKRLSSK